MAIAVTVANDGPGVTGELRLNGGAQGRTRFGLPVDLPTGSRKSLEVYAQPPAFGQTLDVSLVTAAPGRRRRPRSPTPCRTTPSSSSASSPRSRARSWPPSASRRPINGTPAVIVQLTVADLPGRVEAWDPIDRLVWQDIDASTLASGPARRDARLARRRRPARRSSAGPPARRSLAGSPTISCRSGRARRPTSAPRRCGTFVGPIATTVQTIPAMTGDRNAVHGRILASSGDQVIAAEAIFGSGAVTLLGVDPTADWLARTPASDAVWNRPRAAALAERAQLVTGDDSQMLNAVNTLPSLALPPIGGLLILLFGYILLVGPINYLRPPAARPARVGVGHDAAPRRRLRGRRRTRSATTLRGSQVIVNEVAIVRGAPDTTEASATVYVGVFSPTRGTYQVEVPGGALLSSPISGD